MKDLKLLGGLFGTTLSASSVALSTDELDHIVSIVCAVIGVIIVLITSVIIPLIQWRKKAKADGVITKEELEEAGKIISNGVEDVKNAVEDVKNKKEK